MAAPLDGVIVVSLEAAVVAPFATRQLADLGARDAAAPDTTVPALGDHDEDLVAELEARAADRQASGL